MLRLMRRKNPFKLLLLFAGVLLVSCGSPVKEAVDPGGNSNKLLLISFDGFMNEYIERNETPNFDQLIEHGVRAEYLIPVFPTKTFPNHYTIVTGYTSKITES